MKIPTIYQKDLKITKELLSQWYEAKSPVLIDAPPESGKTYNMRKVNEFARKHGLKILATAPRKEAVENIKKECTNCKCIRAKTLQALQSMEPEDMIDYINMHQILILDEIHCMVSDNFMNDNDVFMRTIMEEYKGLIIGMTGTNYFKLEKMFTRDYGKLWNLLKVEEDFGFLQDNTVTFFMSNETAQYIIRKAVADGEKVFVGCDYIGQLEEYRQGHEKNSFTIVSEGNRKKKGLCTKKEKEHLLATGLYPQGKDILFCTRAYELGTNIKPAVRTDVGIDVRTDVTTILIDSDDLTSIMQFCRRVRTKSKGKHVKQVKIYVRAYNAAELNAKREEVEQMLEVSKLFQEDEASFREKYKRKVKDPSGILYPAPSQNGGYELRVDTLKQAYWKKRQEVFLEPDMRYWVHMVCSIFGDCAFKVLSKPQLVDFMEQHEGQMLTKEQQRELKKISGQKTIEGINEACKREGINLRIQIVRENIYVNGKRTQPRKWMVVRI